MKGKRNRKVLAIAVAAIAAVLALCLTLGFTVPVKTMDILVFQNTEDSVTLIVSNHTPTQEDSLGLQVDGGVVAQEIFTEYLPRELGEAEPENALAAYEVRPATVPILIPTASSRTTGSISSRFPRLCLAATTPSSMIQWI